MLSLLLPVSKAHTFLRSSWINGTPSPYYTKKSHIALREFVREWTETHIPMEKAAEFDKGE